MYNEDNTIEQMIIQTPKKKWRHYIPAEEVKSAIQASLDSLTNINRTKNLG